MNLIRSILRRIAGNGRRTAERAEADELARLCALLRRFEGCRLEVYECPAGRLTAGYGSTRTLGGRPFRLGQSITIETAEKLLRRDALKVHTQAIGMLHSEAGAGARIAFGSMIYNFGARRIRHSQALAHFNLGELREAERHYKEWRGHYRADGTFEVLPGLVARRRAEWKLIEETELC